MVTYSVEIPKNKDGHKLVAKLMSKPGIIQAVVNDNLMQVTYDPAKASPQFIYRWVRETKQLPFSSG